MVAGSPNGSTALTFSPWTYGTITPALGGVVVRERLAQDPGWKPDMTWMGRERVNHGRWSGTLPREFCKLLAESLDVPVGVFNYAVGGTWLREWKPQEGAMFRFMEEHLKETGVSEFRGVIWYQGEGDTNVVDPKYPQEYKERMSELIQGFRNLAGDPVAPFLMVQIGRFEGENLEQLESWRRLQKAQEELADDIRCVFVSTAVNSGLVDAVHCDDVGLCSIAKNLHDAAMYYVYDKNTDYKLPAFRNARLNSDRRTIEISFEPALKLILEDWRNQFIVLANGNEMPLIGARISQSRDTLLIYLSHAVNGDICVSYKWDVSAKGQLRSIDGRPVFPFFDEPVKK